MHENMFVKYHSLYNLYYKYNNLAVFHLNLSDVHSGIIYQKCLLTCVCPAMSIEVTFIGKFLVTNFTKMRLIPCMCQAMNIQLVLS